MEDREKRIIEIAKDMCFHADSCIVGAEDRCCKRNCETTWLAEKLVDLNYQKVNADDIVVPKDEYRYIKDMADRYDPFWFCAFGGCEGACKECKDTCEMSIFVKERQKTAKDILNGLECFFWETAINDTKRFDLYQDLYRSIKEHIKNKYNITKEN